MSMPEETEKPLEWFPSGPPFPGRCPSCDAGGLRLEEGTLRYALDAESRDADKTGVLEPWEGNGGFSCLLRCCNPLCEELVVCGGTSISAGDGPVASFGPNGLEIADDVWSRHFPKVIRVLGVARDPSRIPLLPALTEPTEGNSLGSATLDKAGSNGRGASMPLVLDPTDKLVLQLLAVNKGERLDTPSIADRLDLNVKSIGKNLAKLGKAGLIENKPRLGYAITESGSKLASQT